MKWKRVRDSEIGDHYVAVADDGFVFSAWPPEPAIDAWRLYYGPASHPLGAHETTLTLRDCKAIAADIDERRTHA